TGCSFEKELIFRTMARFKEAPWDFKCPYQHVCPHLGGISATWASLLLSDVGRDRFRDGHSWIETEKERKALEEENRELAARVADLESRLKQQHRLRFKPNRKVSAQERESSRKRGAPAGHPPWRRPKPDRADNSVHVDAPSVCPHCKREGLVTVAGTHVQLQEDIVLQPRTVITEYVHQLAYCPECRREVFQTAEGELRNCKIGPVTKAAAVYLRHEVKLSYRDVRKVFTGLFGMSFVPASAMAFSHRTAEQGASFYEDLRDKVRAAVVIHGDETHWRINGKSAQLWYAGNTDFAFFHADPSRGSDVAVSIFGNAFGGNLVADSYAAYNAINPKRRQACLAHLIRKAGEVADRIELMPKKEQDGVALRFCRSVKKFFAICCGIGQRRKNARITFSAAKRHIPRLRRVLGSLCRHPLEDADAENLRKRISDPKRDAQNLFTFLAVNNMPPTNNQAEQSLRLPVIFRKISFGSRSLYGAQTLAVNLSLLTTAKRQDRNPVDLLKNLLLHGGNTPRATLYKPNNMPAWDSS
ncbi:MAG: IS66 family transposase, partial [Lentisphaeria bacterium]|nr:IS66 family transposase [Lentisphaeria bacterium]